MAIRHVAVDPDYGIEKGMGTPIERDTLRFWQVRCSCGWHYGSRQKPAALRHLHEHIRASA